MEARGKLGEALSSPERSGAGTGAEASTARVRCMRRMELHKRDWTEGAERSFRLRYETNVVVNDQPQAAPRIWVGQDKGRGHICQAFYALKRDTTFRLTAKLRIQD